jgi:type I restriction enzyme, S subunit
LNWKTVNMGSLTRIRTGKLDANAADEEGKYPFFTCAVDPLRINTPAFDCKAVLVAGNGDLNVKYYEGMFNAYQRTYVIEVHDETVLFPRYLYRFLDSYVSKLRQLSIGGVIKYIKLPNLTNAPLPLPPLPEQKRIAAIIDKADEIRRNRELAISKLDCLAQSVFVEMFGDPARNSRSLPLVPLGDIGSWHSGGTPPRLNKENFVGDIPWFSSGELEDMYVFKSKERISVDALKNTSAKLVRKGELMLGMYDTAALKSSIAGLDCSCNQAIAFAAIDERRALTSYVYFAIRIGRDHFRRLQRGVRQKNLNLELIRNIRIPVPPIAEQEHFASVLKGCDELKKRLHIARTKSMNLVDSLRGIVFSTDAHA